MKFKRGLPLYVVQILALYAVNAELAEAESVRNYKCLAYVKNLTQISF